MGLHRYDAKVMIVQTISAVICGYGAGRVWGMEGILLGLIIPTVIFTLINKGIVISKVAFEIKAYKYLKDIGRDLLSGITIIVAVGIICNHIVFTTPVATIFLKGIISLAISGLFIILFSFKSPYFNETVLMLKNIIIKKRT